MQKHSHLALIILQAINDVTQNRKQNITIHKI